jgi:hypothetical protein
MQLSLSVKSAEFVPVRATAVMVSGPVPEFVRVVDCNALVVPAVSLPKPSEVGKNVTAGD